MPDILISTSSFGIVSSRPLEQLRDAGFSIRTNPYGRALTPTESARLMAGIVGVVAGTERLDHDLLAGIPSLRAISRLGAGLENVDLAAAEALDIAVTSTPEPPAQAVAELALGGLLTILRNSNGADRDIRSGIWNKPMGRLLSGATLGVVGTGRAGKAFVNLIAPFDCSVLAVDVTPNVAWARSRGVTYVELDELVRSADVVTLHVPLTSTTRGLMDRDRLGSMKAGAFLVNCARGGLVDEAALSENLKAGHLGGAFLDVFENEPYSGDLTNLPNTLLTPHIGSYASECRLAMELEAADNLIRMLRTSEDRS